MFQGNGRKPDVRPGAGPWQNPTQSPVPGKRTLTQDLAAQLPVQRAAAPPRAGKTPSEEEVHQAAAQGIATPATPLPFSDAIQRSFGRHSVAGIQAHQGDGATASAGAMGAHAYAAGNHVVLGEGGRDLFTAAHEAAHVVQQRGGVQLKGGVGAQGDAYERHADEVAAHVVQGKSAEGLLDRFAGPGAGAASSASAPAVQRVVSVGPSKHETPVTFEEIWPDVQKDERLRDPELQRKAQELLRTWIRRAKAYSISAKEFKADEHTASNRKYRDAAEIVSALLGELSSQTQANLGHETQLATRTLNNARVQAGVNSVLTKLKDHHDRHKAALGPAAATQEARYSGWAYGEEEGMSIAKGLEAVTADASTTEKIGFIADYSYKMNRVHPATLEGGKTKYKERFDQGMTAELGAARDSHFNPNEDNEWTKEARRHHAPLGAGPSATTAQVLAFAAGLPATRSEMAALAWALFAIWNTMPLHQADTHRFHEVFAVANGFGVAYEAWKYTEPMAGVPADSPNATSPNAGGQGGNTVTQPQPHPAPQLQPQPQQPPPQGNANWFQRFFAACFSGSDAQ